MIDPVPQTTTQSDAPTQKNCKGKEKRGPLNDSAMHLVASVAHNVLDAKTKFLSIKFFKINAQGNLTIGRGEVDFVKDAAVAAIQAKCNALIAEDVSFDDLKFSEITTEGISNERAKKTIETLLEGCTHVTTLGELKAVYIKKFSVKKSKIEILFYVGDEAVEALANPPMIVKLFKRKQGNNKKKTSTINNNSNISIINNDAKTLSSLVTPCHQALSDIVNDIVIPACSNILGLDEQDQKTIKKLKATINDDVEDILNRLINQTYAQAFESAQTTGRKSGGLF